MCVKLWMGRVMRTSKPLKRWGNVPGYTWSRILFRISRPSSTLCVKGPICTVRIEPGSMTASCGDSEVKLRGGPERNEAWFVRQNLTKTGQAREQPERWWATDTNHPEYRYVPGSIDHERGSQQGEERAPRPKTVTNSRDHSRACIWVGILDTIIEKKD